MSVMILALLAMNGVLAAGLLLVWRQQQHLAAENEDLRDQVRSCEAQQQAMQERINELHQAPQFQPANERMPQEDIAGLLHKGLNMPTQMPEKYQAAVSLAGSGMTSDQLVDVLGLSTAEAGQLSSLAQIAAQVPGSDETGDQYRHSGIRKPSSSQPLLPDG